MVIRWKIIPRELKEIFEDHISKIHSERNINKLKKFKIHSNFKEFDNKNGNSLRLVKGDNTKTIVAKIKSEFSKMIGITDEPRNYWKAYVEESMTLTEYIEKIGLTYTEEDETIIEKHLKEVHEIILDIFWEELNFKLLCNDNCPVEVRSLADLLEWLNKGSIKNFTYNEEKGLYDLFKESQYERNEKQAKELPRFTSEKIDSYMSNYGDIANSGQLEVEILKVLYHLSIVSNHKWYSEKMIRTIIGRLFNSDVEREKIFSTENLMKAMEVFTPRVQSRNRSYQREEEYKRNYGQERREITYKVNDTGKPNYQYNNKRSFNKESRFEGYNNKGKNEPKISYGRNENMVTETRNQKMDKTYAITEESDEEEHHPRKKAKYGDNNH